MPQAQRKISRALKGAFPHTIPIFAGFCFLGMTYGIYMKISGFAFWYPMLMSLVIYGGSLEFVAVSMLLAPYAPMQALLMTLVIQARHLFYGIAMLDKFRGMGWKKPYLIFGMCDEISACVTRHSVSTVPPKSRRTWTGAGFTFS